MPNHEDQGTAHDPFAVGYERQGRAAAKPGPCWLHLTNGWTVSISASDTPPALCSVAAWPSELDNAVGVFKTGAPFDFDGRSDQRCFVLEDVREALALVEAADPPA